jgi:hypothetical protein
VRGAILKPPDEVPIQDRTLGSPIDSWPRAFASGPPDSVECCAPECPLA